MTILIRQAARIPTNYLEMLGQVEIPLGTPPSQLRGKRYQIGEQGVRTFGIWECSPGHWRRTIMEEEFAHFISGSARFIPDEGEPIDIHAGDTIWFPPNSCGVWEITEDVRKVYIVVYRRSMKALLRSAWSRLTALWDSTFEERDARNLGAAVAAFEQREACDQDTDAGCLPHAA